METRKRPVVDDAEASLPKKRALIDSRGSPTPHVNGLPADADEVKDDNLERFRKDAIYRRMKHYSREYDRSQTRIEELERWKRSCEVGLAALEACWTQLVDTARTILQPGDDATAPNVQTHDIFDLSTHVTDTESGLVEALQAKLDGTKAMLTIVVQRGAPSSLKDESFRRSQRMQAECIALRSEMSVLRAQLRDSEASKKQLHVDLVSAERRADRLKSSVYVEATGKAESPPAQENTAPAEHIKEERNSPSSPPPSSTAVTNDVLVAKSEADTWQALAESRERSIDALEKDLVAARAETVKLKLLAAAPSMDMIRNIPLVHGVFDRDDQVQHELKRLLEEKAQLWKSRDRLEDEHEKIVHNLKATFQGDINELKGYMTKRDEELLRLRRQRDEASAELVQLKAKESGKVPDQKEDYRAVAEARVKRIDTLQSEVSRLRAQLAAKVGMEDAMKFFGRDKTDTVSYVEDLQGRLRAAESRADAANKALSALSQSSPDVAVHVQAEAAARSELAESQRRLQAFEAAFGPDASANTAQLADRLREKEAEVERLHLQLQQKEEVETMLDEEFTKVTTQCAELEAAVNTKMFEYSSFKDRIERLAAERAKQENKYFAAARARQAVEAERDKIAAIIEKQSHALDHVKEQSASRDKQATTWKQELDSAKALNDTYANQIGKTEQDLLALQQELDTERQRMQLIQPAMKSHEDGLQQQRESLRQETEKAIRAQKDAERQAAKAKTLTELAPVPMKGKDGEMQAQVNNLMKLLKCSTCHQRMRDTVLTKCMHSFCKDCVEARVQTRQRKCPACNLGFSQSEVQTLYFQ